MTRRNSRSTGYVAAKIRANTARKTSFSKRNPSPAAYRAPRFAPHVHELQGTREIGGDLGAGQDAEGYCWAFTNDLDWVAHFAGDPSTPWGAGEYYFEDAGDGSYWLLMTRGPYTFINEGTGEKVQITCSGRPITVFLA